MGDILKEFGKRVRDLRKAQGLSQEDLAERAGLHYTYIGGVERGERNLSLKSIEMIADALEVDIRGLFVVPSLKRLDAECSNIIGDINRLIADKNIAILQLVKLLVKDVIEWSKDKKI